MKILVLNCGSSSIKFQLIDSDNDFFLIAKGIIERMGSNKANLKYSNLLIGKKFNENVVVPEHITGVNLIAKTLINSEIGVINSIYEIKAVGHRVAHGGEKFSESVLINETVEEKITELSELAPLHNPVNMKGILAVNEILPNVKQVAVFDTSFHYSIPPEAHMYGLPMDYYKKYKIRRYGFHGTSHKFVAKLACEHLGVDINTQKIVSCHLGSGASICAIKNGKSVETSMGFTPVEGLLMGTRTGDLDLGALLYIGEKENLSIKELNNLINKKSGMLGITGVDDMRDIENRAENGDKIAILALDMYNHRVKKYIGAYSAVMDGIDILIFTAGIGENGPETRDGVASELKSLGLNFDKDKNNKTTKGNPNIQEISADNSKMKCLIVPTNEELVIAQETVQVIGKI